MDWDRFQAEAIGEYVEAAIDAYLAGYRGGPGMLRPITPDEIYRSARLAARHGLASLSRPYVGAF